MNTRTTPRAALAAGLFALVLLAAGCSSSTDPETWAEALEDGKVEENFLATCVDADEGRTADEVALVNYCQCSFTQLQETFADDLGRFRAIEDELRRNPLAIEDFSLVDDPEVRADMRLAAGVLEGCQQEFLA